MKQKWIYNLAIKIIVYSTLFWIGETLAFILTDGWHYKATREMEIILDKMVGYGWNTGVALWVFQIVRYLDNKVKDL